VGYSVFLAVERAVAWSAWAARSRSKGSKLNSSAACPAWGSSMSNPRSAAHRANPGSSSLVFRGPGTTSLPTRGAPGPAGLREELQPVAGRDIAPGGDRDGAGGVGVSRVDVERRGGIDLADAADQPDAHGRAEPREGRRKRVRQIAPVPLAARACRPECRGASRGRPAPGPPVRPRRSRRVARPAAARRRCPRSPPPVVVTGAVDDVTLAPHPFHLRVLAAQAGDVRPVRGGPGDRQGRPAAASSTDPAQTPRMWAPRPARRVIQSRSGASSLPAGPATAGTTTTSGSGTRPTSTSSSECFRHQGQAAGEHADRPARGHRVHRVHQECR